jgi:hypothetical protein
LAAALLETAAAWEKEGAARGEGREVVGAVEETFLARMILVCMDLATGSLLLEEVADDRTYATWKTLVEDRLQGLGTGVLYLVSDRAQALIQLAEPGLACLSMPDFFHVVQALRHLAKINCPFMSLAGWCNSMPRGTCLAGWPGSPSAAP